MNNKYITILKKIIPLRFYFIFSGLVLIVPWIINQFIIPYNIKLSEQQYFWLLSSLVQGFAALLGIVIIVIIFRLQHLSNQKNGLSKLIKDNIQKFTTNKESIAPEEYAFLNDEDLLKYSKKLLSSKEVIVTKPSKIQLKQNIKLLESLKVRENSVKTLYFVPFVTLILTILFSIIGLILPGVPVGDELLWYFMFISFSMAFWSILEMIKFTTDLLIEEF